MALLAGIGATWYTWLEQGRTIRPSVEGLNAVATALRLDNDERRHLFMLAGRPAPDAPETGPEIVQPPLIHMLEKVTDQPAYVLGRRWDVLAWNEAAVAIFGNFAELAGDQRNIMHMMFANPSHRRLLADWDDLAPISLAMFRADSARYAGDPEFERLISLLKRESFEFRAWWPHHEVLNQPSTLKRVRHPQAGALDFEYMNLEVGGHPGMRVVVCTPRTKEGDQEA